MSEFISAKTRWPYKARLAVQRKIVSAIRWSVRFGKYLATPVLLVFPLREFYVERDLPASLRERILRLVKPYPLSVRELTAGQTREGMSSQFLQEFCPEIAEEIERGIRLLPEQVYFSIWTEPNTHSDEELLHIQVLTFRHYGRLRFFS